MPSASNFVVLLLLHLLVINFAAPSYSLCPNKCTCDDSIFSVECKDSPQLDFVPITLNPSIVELHLPRNNIKSIASALTFYRNLLFLDLSSNVLTSLGESNFASQKSLRVLIVSGNRISSLEDGAFLGLESLRTLSLSGNKIRSLPPKAFSSLKFLEKLDLSHNDLTPELIHPNVFDSRGISSHLRNLDLSHNRINFIPKKLFSRLKNLSSLNLGFNSIGKSGFLSSNDAAEEECLEGILRNNSFVHLSSLTDLNLESNQLETLESHAFYGLQDSLENLDLSFNHLEAVPSIALSMLTRLSSITLSRNRIVVLNDNCLTGLLNLKTFILKNDDNLKAIEVDAFESNPLLERVSIEFCPNIKQVHEETFILQRESSLKQVSLRANGLTSLPRHLFSWTSLVSLDIRGNPFDCSDGCFTDWLSRLISGNSSNNRSNNLMTNNIIPEEFTREILCHDPLELRGHEVASLTEEELSNTNKEACSSNSEDIDNNYITQNGNDLYVSESRRQLSIVSGTANKNSSSPSSFSWLITFAIISALISACVVCFLFLSWRRRRTEFLTEMRLKEYFSNNSRQLVLQYHYYPSYAREEG